MSVQPDRPLAWFGVGATVAGVAFTVRPAHAPSVVFWVLLALGIGTVAVGLLIVVRDRVLRPESQAKTARKCALAALECRRVEEWMTSFLDDQIVRRPRGSPAGSKQGRYEHWRQETAQRYRKELRTWAVKVFDLAVLCGAISDAARPLVEAPTAEQIFAVRDLFGEIAVQLELMSRSRVPA